MTKKGLISIIATVQEDGGIGIGNDHQWDFSENARNWMNITKGSAYFMGRKTYEIQEEKGNISAFMMDGRILKIITGQGRGFPIAKGAYRMPSVKDAIDCVLKHNPGKDIFIAGGQGVYEEAFGNLLDLVNRIHLTRVDSIKEGATHFLPVYEPTDLKALGFSLIEGGGDFIEAKRGIDKGVMYRNEVWSR